MIRIEHADMLEAIPRLVAEGVVCDAVATDPPYHLTATLKRFGAANSAPAQHGRDGAMSRLSGGFMGQQWDGGDIAFRPETWATVATILRPGAFLVAFGGTRTYHRLVCAIEDAGFVIQDQIAWLFGTGFPKRRDMLKPAFEPICLAYKPGGERTMQIDECRIGTDGGTSGASYAKSGLFGIGGKCEITQLNVGRWPANVCHDGSDEVVAAFPESDGAISNSSAGQKSGAGWLTQPREITPGRGDSGSAARFFFSTRSSNICQLCGINDCDAPNAALSLNTGGMTSPEGSLSAQSDAPASIPPADVGKVPPPNGIASGAANASLRCHPTTGDIARQGAEPWPIERIAQSAKSAARLCGSCAIAIAQHLAAVRLSGSAASSLSIPYIAASSKTILIRSLARYVAHRESTDIILTTASLSELFGSVFHAIAANTNSANLGQPGKSGSGRLWYSSKAGAEDRWGSRHPTVKPVELMKWLVALVTPPNGLVLDPFAGSGTTGAAALGAGRDAILIEREDQYAADIRERMAFYEGGGQHSAVAKHRSRTVEHGPLFDQDFSIATRGGRVLRPNNDG